MKIKVRNILFCVLFFSGCLWMLTSFAPNLPGYEKSIQIVRKHNSPETFLNKNDDIYFKTLVIAESSLNFIDRHVPYFPSLVISNFWNQKSVYVLINLPFVLLLSFAVVLLPKIAILIILFFFLFYLPNPQIYSRSLNNLVLKTNFRYLLPNSEKYVWIWGDEVKPNSITSFSYDWNQKKSPSEAKIRVSCLGHYHLKVNDNTVYYGPVFAKFPKTYYDEIDITSNTKIGVNKIVIDCEFLSVKTHEHEIFNSPGILVGGFIKDGFFAYNLGDYRFWKSSESNIYYTNRLSQDAGFTEIVDLTVNKNFNTSTHKLDQKIETEPRPIDYLKQKVINPSFVNNFYDLGRIIPGYLKLSVNLKNSCRIDVSYFDSYSDGRKILLDDQKDIFLLSAGNYSYQQFSRRTGRYIQIVEKDCDGIITPEFVASSYPLDTYSQDKILDNRDKSIFTITQNSIKNGVQDQIEDSLVRERALYVGDAYSVYQCVPPSNINSKYFKYILTSFADSQLDNGAIPAMAHSANPFIIPDYSIIFGVFLDDYTRSNQDFEFKKKMEPVIKKLISWTEQNVSTEGYLYDKNNQNWWTFIDWTERDISMKYSTGLNLYYVLFLRSVGEQNASNALLTKLYKYALNANTGKFSDSFDGTGKMSGTSIAVNALAGKFNLFPDEKTSLKAFNYFKDQNTSSPYSQTWLVQWSINLNKNDIARNQIRNYWGDMVRKGATSVYETYTPGRKNIDSSHSHAWGCGPVFLYQQIY